MPKEERKRGKWERESGKIGWEKNYGVDSSFSFYLTPFYLQFPTYYTLSLIYVEKIKSKIDEGVLGMVG